jgi:phosphoribosyl 1,2-cyclic phosphate phosphodiesterase
MPHSLKFTILGCGNSAGSPAPGNHWGHCDRNEPKNIRTRPGVWIQSEETSLVIDTSADFRVQSIAQSIPKVDAVFYTHAHGDHVHGIDDLRGFRLRTGKLIETYGDRKTLEEIQERFAYMFETRADIYPQILNPNIIESHRYNETLDIFDIKVVPFEQDHGTCKTLGLRFGDLAYSTDVVALDDKALGVLKGIKTWVVDAAGYKMEKNFVHFTLRQVIEMNSIIQAERVYLTHMPGYMDYQQLLKELPDGYLPCYDGLELRANY